jgi:large subunit ribosomal protein L9
MKVILKETIDSLGIIGSEVSVADGYARNYLLPQNKAVAATVVCTIAAKVSEEDRLYGSVSVRDIVDTLTNQDIVVEKRMVLLKEPIKALGSYNVPIRVYKEVEPEITVEIVPE